MQVMARVRDGHADRNFFVAPTRESEESLSRARPGRWRELRRPDHLHVRQPFGGQVPEAREFPRSQISKSPVVNGRPPQSLTFTLLEAGKFADWQLEVDGMVANPGSFSLDDLRGFPARSQITHLACEEGWSFIAEWIGVPLSHVLNLAGALPEARYVVYFSIQSHWWDSVDMADALHPQTLLTYGMNGGDLPVGHGGPLRLRVPRQLGYKSVKYITRLIVTDSLKDFGKGLGSSAPEAGYAWYAGI